MESAKSGVTCNTICPGWVRTALAEAQIQARAEEFNKTTEEAALDLLARVPQCEFIEDSAIGDMVAHLCQECSRNITGTEIIIDGGITAV